jgi:hypothetical protein
MSAPEQMQMADTAVANFPGIGAGEEGPKIAKTMGDKHNFQIVRQIGHHGCCYAIETCTLCNDEIEGRSYRVIGENFIEINMARATCCRCCVMDNITKIYMDDFPFVTVCDKWCGGETYGSYITEKDTSYCCYCIPTLVCFDYCTKPCFGGFVAKVPCERGTFCFNFCTRVTPCCIRPIFDYVEDSEDVRKILQAQQQAFFAMSGGMSTTEIVMTN